MSNVTALDYGYNVVIFNGDEDDLSWVYEIQDNNQREKLIYVALRGTTDKYLYPDRFLVENYHVDMKSHFLYNDLFTEEDEREYITQKCLEFARTGKRLFIEQYEFTEGQDFYDYTK
jgi:hypothetical protein